jgi:dTDP-4-dehydrorhamnose reductase
VIDDGGATLVLGGNGQLGRALRRDVPEAEFLGRSDVDLQGDGLEASRDWARYGTVINAAAYTRVDEAETPTGRREAWAVNVEGTARLARLAHRHGFTLVQVSSDYVFDGSLAVHHEDEPVAPLGVYGQTKAAADAIVATLERHYVVRTSWVIGDGGNFVRTMAALARRGVEPEVVDDQVGRLTFASTLSEGIVHLLRTGAPFGTYNVTNSGDPLSWAAIARSIYSYLGHDPGAVRGVSTRAYFADRSAAPRPLQSTLDLAKLRGTGLATSDHLVELGRYLTATDGTGPGDQASPIGRP